MTGIKMLAQSLSARRLGEDRLCGVLSAAWLSGCTINLINLRH